MIPVFCCGLECGVLGLHFGNAGGVSISTTTVRTGLRSLRLNGTSASSQAQLTLTSQTRWILRFYIQFTTLPSADTIIACVSGANPPGVFFKQSDSKLYACVGTGALGASGASVTTGQWYRIDVDWNVNTGGNDTSDLQVDGTAAGQATATGMSAAATTLIFGSGSATTHDFFFDDFVLSNTAADYPIGAGYVNHFVPTADGTHNIAGTGDFQRGNTGVDITNATTTAYQLIDDIPLPSGTVDEADNQRAVAPPNDTDYVECVFGPAPGISTPTVGPRAVEMVIAYHQIATQTGQMIIELNDNGTVNTMFDTGAAAGVTTYRYARKQYATPPTGGSWGVVAGNGNFNNVRCRFRAIDATPDQCYDAGMIEAEFAPAVAARTPRTVSIGHPFII